jgi:FixJ family two-component response regulator
MKRGAIDFRTKPFDEENLLKAVQEALKKDIANRIEMNERQNILHFGYKTNEASFSWRKRNLCVT